MLEAIGAALVAAGAPGALSQPHFMVSGGGSFRSGVMAVWRVEAGGAISLHQQLNLPAGAGLFGIDPFGRFLVFNTFAIDPDGPNFFRVELWEIRDDHTLALADVVSSETVGYSATGSALTMDGQWWVAKGSDLSLPGEDPMSNFYQAFRITEDLRLGPAPRSLFHSLEGPLAEGAFLSTVGHGAQTPLLLERGLPSYFILQVSSSGEVTWDGTEIFINGSQASGGGAVRPDGRVAIAAHSIGSLSSMESISLGIGPGAKVSVLDIIPFAIQSPVFAPNGLSVVGGGDVRRLAVGRDGIFPGALSEISVPFVWGTAMSPDGRLAVMNYQMSGQGFVFASHALEGEADLPLLGFLPNVGGWEGMAFLPPRTEEMLGDANADGLRDAADIVTYVNHFSDPGTLPEWHPLSPRIRGPVPEARADANQDGEITAKDLEWLIDFLLIDTADL